MIRSFELQNSYLDEKDPWKGILSATAFAIRSTLHTTLKHTPGQLVFGQNMILNIQHQADWEAIKIENKNSLTRTMRERMQREDHTPTMSETKSFLE